MNDVPSLSRQTGRVMRSLLGAILALVPTLAMSAQPSSPLIPAAFFQRLNRGEHQTVVTYGTSLTAGGAWVTALKEWFEAQYPGLITFVNSGSSGENSDYGLAHLKAKVLDHKPDLVFIEFSYNDAHEKFKMTLDRGATNLDQMVKAIRGVNPACAIVLQTMNVGWDAPNGNRSLSVRPQLNQFNDNYRKYAAANQLPFLDHYEAWLKLKTDDPKVFESYIPDGSHPTKEGSLKITWPAVEKLLGESRQAAGN